MNHLKNSIQVLLFSGTLVCTALPPLNGSVTAQTVGSNVNLSKAAGNQYETAVAIDPNNHNNIFVAGRNELGGLATARSSDGGVTWIGKMIGAANPPAPGNVPRAYGNASVAWDNFGNLFLAYLSQNSSVSQFLYVTIAVSTDGGASFYSPTGVGSAIIVPPNGPSYYTGDQPTVAVGPGSGGFPGSVWVTYFSMGGIWVSGAGVSGLGAVGSFTSQPLPSQPVAVNFGDIAVGPNGEVIVTYGPDSGASGAVYTNVDVDGLGPAPFSNYTPVAPVNIGGFSYIPAQPNWGIDPEAGLAYDRSNGPHRGRVYLVYTDAPSAGSTDTNIFVVRSDDQGATWSTPVRVNDDAGAGSQFLPHISLDQSNGMIAVTWYDARNSPNNDTAQYFGAFSIDGGESFGANFQISSGASDQARSIAALKKADYGDYTGNAFVNGRLVAAWADNSNSTGDNPDGATDFDIYAAIVQPPASLLPAVTVSFPAPNATGWYISSLVAGTVAAASGSSSIVAIACSGGTIGNISGLNTGSVSASISVSAQGSQAVSCTASDAAGNTGTSPEVAVPIDSIAPTLAPALSPGGTPLLLHSEVFALPNTADTGSGIKTAACGTVDTSSAGVKSLTCTAADNAGNTSSADLNYVVGYAIDSVTLHPEGAVRPGSILEIRFQVVDAKGETISDSIAKNLDRAVTAALGTAIAAAEYNPAKDRFEAELKISPKIVAGVYPLVINIRQGGVNLGTATVSVTVGK